MRKEDLIKEFPFYLDNKRVKNIDIVDYNMSILKKAKSYQIDLLENITESEALMQKLLSSMKIKFRREHIFPINKYGCKYIEGFYILDFYLIKYHLCIEVDGGYHKDPAQRARDCARDKVLSSKANLKTLRVKNEELLDPETLKEKIMTFIKENPRIKIKRRYRKKKNRNYYNDYLKLSKDGNK